MDIDLTTIRRNFVSSISAFIEGTIPVKGMHGFILYAGLPAAATLNISNKSAAVTTPQGQIAWADECCNSLKAFRPMDGIVDEIALCWGFFKRAKATGLPQERLMIITKNLGMLLLAIYLILVGITALVHIAIPMLVTGVLALAAGILILIGR